MDTKTTFANTGFCLGVLYVDACYKENYERAEALQGVVNELRDIMHEEDVMLAHHLSQGWKEGKLYQRQAVREEGLDNAF